MREFADINDIRELDHTYQKPEWKEEQEEVQDIPPDFSEDSAEMQEYEAEISEEVQDIPDDLEPDYDEMVKAVRVDEIQEIPTDEDNMGSMLKNAKGSDIPDLMNHESSAAEKAEQDEGSDTRDIDEIMDDFSQENWERLSDTERQEAIAELGEYAANDLGIKNKPEVKFYSGDETEFGYYTEDENAIYINVENMGDAAEVADTITHETRHRYQHERADSPETDEDYAFRDNFDNYITPDVDFEGYEEQIVERDAREYGQKYKDMVKERS